MGEAETAALREALRARLVAERDEATANTALMNPERDYWIGVKDGYWRAIEATDATEASREPEAPFTGKQVRDWLLGATFDNIVGEIMRLSGEIVRLDEANRALREHEARDAEVAGLDVLRLIRATRCANCHHDYLAHDLRLGFGWCAADEYGCTCPGWGAATPEAVEGRKRLNDLLDAETARLASTDKPDPAR